jgi:NAD(P)-dependent dehydrogenase (short-subunit alcohol dehydrogenase family)
MAAMANLLEGKHVVITGGSGGLGGAVVDAFVAAGATCHLPQRGPAGPARSSIEFRANVDLASEPSVVDYYATLPPLWASVHLAGGYAGKPFAETSLAALREQLELNLVTAFLCCREAVRALRKSGGGRIVNVCSRAALVPGGGSVAYAAAKAAVAMLTQAVAEEVKADRILVNAVAPSIIDTAANRASMPKANHALWPKPAELAAALLWLSSPENQLTSGTILPVYGAA